jgi:hypothetical protein
MFVALRKDFHHYISDYGAAHSWILPLLVGFLAVPICLRAQAPADSLRTTVQVSMSAAATAAEVPLNRLAAYTIKLKWQGPLSAIEFNPPELPQLSNFKIAGSSSSNWVGVENGQPASIKTFEYSLHPEGLGMGYVDGMRVSYLDKATGEQHSLYTSRVGIKVVDPLAEPDEAPLGLALTIGLLLCAGLAILFFQIEARAKKQAAAQLAATAVKPLEEEFLEELKNTVNINTTELKDAFASLSKLLRRYLHRRYEIPTQGISTQEVVAAFRSLTAAEEQAAHTEEILQTCDLFKFSGEAGEPARLARVYALTENFLQMNKSATPVRRNDAR